MIKFLIDLLIALAVRLVVLVAGGGLVFLAGYALAGTYGADPVAGGMVTLALFAVFAIGWTWADGRRERRR